VFQLAYRRFIDIEKAEAQAREAQIEAALERVRGKAMAMHSTKDLSSTVGIFFKQLKGLGIIPIRCGVGQIDGATCTTNLTTTTSSQLGHSFDVIGKVKQTGHPVLDGIFENWQLQKEYHPVLEGDDIKSYYRIMNRQINYPEYREDVTQYGNMFYFKEGFVFAWTEKRLSEEELKIFRRFTSVLSLTYRRYLDLREAEAQAREAQLELALERIRAQVTAMRESSELLDIVVMMQAEFIKLGHEAHYFWHMRWLPDKYEKALTNGEGTRIGNVLELPRGFHGLQTMLDWEKTDEPSGVFALDPETAADYIDKMIKLGRFQEIDHSAPDPDDVRAMGGLTFVMARTTHGEIGYTLPGEVPNPPQEDVATLVRFAHVFDLAYRRFEDLKSAERQNRIIQAENERKSKELEEARQMQLSMLPKEIPELENLEIAVHMQTATEVGGDYFDFSLRDDGSVNIALGDATGHGMKAGIMVSSMKSIFTTNSPKMNIDEFFRTANGGVKSMNLKRMMMGFTMLNIQNYNFQMINAGMPPVFYYNNSSKLVEEIKEHGVPIGAMNNIEFKTIRGSLKKGDSILFLTDGMPELHNRKNEMYGYDRIREVFRNVAEKKSEEIITFLVNESSAWLENQDLEDDVTFVVIKVK
jgi:serine phosphatase RsbU (regulator of sigma subunit)